MTNVIEIRSHANESESRTTLDALCLEGARTMLHRALEVEAEEYLERHREARDENGHALVTVTARLDLGRSRSGQER
jgi:hypothetical protein